MIPFAILPGGRRACPSLRAKGGGVSLKLILNTRLSAAFAQSGKAEKAMKFDDGDEDGRSIFGSVDPAPPEDWIGYEAHARATTLYREHRPALAGFLKNRAPAQEVGDLLQECFRRLFSSRSYPRILGEEPRAYLFRTARNLLAERHRSRTRRMADEHRSFEDPNIAGPDPHLALEARDQMRRIEDALARLKPRTRTIFLLHRFDGLSYDEIAAAEGISVKGVEKQIAKAMLAIRRARTRHS